MEKMPNWGGGVEENSQNLNLLVKKRLKIKGFFYCHARPTGGPFVTSMLRLMGLHFHCQHYVDCMS